MNSKVMRSALLIIGAMAAICGLARAADRPALYTAAQADDGSYIFTHRCAECHGSQMEGLTAPALKGFDFRQRRSARITNAQALLTFISLYMPRGKPASLTAEEYSDIAAFILQQNGFPAGNTKLSADTPNLQDVELNQ